MTKWTGFNFSSPPEVVESVKPIVDTVAGALNVLLDLTIIATQIASFLISLAIDPINSVLQFALDFLEDLIQKMAALGFYILTIAPDNTDVRLATGYQGFVRTIEQSLFDPGDSNRPLLSDDVPYFAAAAVASVAIPDINRIQQEFGGLARLFEGLTPKFDGLKGKSVPQSGFMGVLDPPPNKEPKSVVTLGLEGNNIITVTQSGWVSFPDEERVVYKKVAPYIVPEDAFKNDAIPIPGKFCFIMAVKDPDVDDEAAVVTVPVGTVVEAEDGSYTVNVDLFEYPFAGTKGVILASVEYASNGDILRFDPSFNVRIPPLDLEGKGRLLGEATEPNWRALVTLRDWSPMKDFIEMMNQSMRKFQTPVDKQIGVEYQLELLQNIKAYLTDLQQRVNSISTTLQNMLIGVGAGSNLLWITPWPTLFSQSDPFDVEPGSKVSFTLDPITAGGGAPQEVEIQAESGYFTSENKTVFDIPDGSSFDLEISVKRAIVDSESAAETLGLDAGSEVEQGVFRGSAQAKIRTPSATSGIKLSTFGNYIAVNNSSVLDMLGVTSGIGFNGQLNRPIQRRYHYPSGASMLLSAWSNDTELTGGTLLPYIGMSSYSKNASGVLTGNPIQNFKIVPNTSFRLTTRSLNRAYPSSSIGSLTGIAASSALSRLQDKSVDSRVFDITDLATFRFSLGIKNLEVLSGNSLPYLGLSTVSSSVGQFSGESAFKFTSLEMGFSLSAKANTVELTPTPFLQTLRMDAVLNSRGSIQGIDSRFFSWEQNAGFELTVRNVLNQIVYTGEVRIPEGGTSRSGTALATRLTQAMRAVVGAVGTEFCQYDSATGFFTFFFSGAASSVTLVSLTPSSKNILGLVGLPTGSISTPSGLFVGSEPESYAVNINDSFVFSAGKENFSISLGSGSFTGTQLALILQGLIRVQTERLETVTYNPSTGRFRLTLDPVGYTLFSGAVLELPELDLESPEDVLAALNSQLINQSIPGHFSFNNRSLVFTSSGMTYLEFTETQGSPFSVFGLSPGLISAVDAYTAGVAKNFYFTGSTRSLVIRKNRTNYSFNLLKDTPMSFEDVISNIQSYVSGLSITFPQNAFRFVLNDVLMLVLNQIVVMGPGDYFTESEIAQELKDQIRFFIGDSLAEVTSQNSSFSVYYPEMTTFSLHVTGLGEDLLAILGFNPGSIPVLETFTGSLYRPYRITNANRDFSITLGSSTFSVNIPVGRKTPALLASQLSAAITGITVSYVLGDGTFVTSFSPGGYTQVNNQVVTLAPGTYTGISLASHATTLLRGLPNASQVAEIIPLSNSFVYLDPQTVSITLSSNAGSFSGLRPLGFSAGSHALSNNRYSGSTPVRFFIDGTNNTAVYSVYTSTVNVNISSSTDYETGQQLAQRLTQEFNAQTGQNESFTYLASARTFTLNPPSSGFKILDDYSVVLPSNTGFITPQALAAHINSEIPSGSGLSLFYDSAQDKFFWTMDSLSRIELAEGLIGYSLLTFTGFSPASYQTPNQPIYSQSSPENLVITSLSNQLSIQLGGQVHSVSLTPDSQVYPLPAYLAQVQDAVQLLSERASTVSSYSVNTSPWVRFSVAPGGEYLIKEQEVTGLTPATFYTVTSFASALTAGVQALPGAGGSETINYDIAEDRFYFADVSGATISVAFSDSSNFDLKQVLGVTGTTNIPLVSNKALFQDPATYVITGDNNVLGYDLNGFQSNFVIPDGVYSGEDLASELSTLFPDPYAGAVTWEDFVFEISSNPSGNVYFNETVVITPAYQGSPSGLETVLTSAIQALSIDGDENFVFNNFRFELHKPSIYSVKATPSTSSAYQYILRHIGITESFIFTAQSLNPGIVIFDYPATFNVTPLSNSFIVELDTLDPIECDLEETAFPLTGPQMADIIETAIIRRLDALSFKHMLHKYSYTIIDQALANIATDYRHTDFKVTERLNKALEKELSDTFFNQLGEVNKTAVATLFAPLPAQSSALIPRATNAYSQVLSTANSAVKALNAYQKGMSLIRYSAFANRAFIEILDNLPDAIDRDNLPVELGSVIDTALDVAAVAENIPTVSVLPSTWENQKLLWKNIALSRLTELFNSKYFNDVTCVYDESTGTFKVTSPTKGSLSKVVISAGSSNDIADYLGFLTGVETPGTGNVSFSHMTTTGEMSSQILSQTNLASYSWGVPSFKFQGDTISKHYPFRRYTRDEMPSLSAVVVHPVSINWGSSATIDVASVSGNLQSELAFPSSATGVSGAQGFVGAFREAGPPDSVPDNDQAFMAGVVVVAVVPSPTDTVVAPILDTFENLATLMGLNQNA